VSLYRGEVGGVSLCREERRGVSLYRGEVGRISSSQRGRARGVPCTEGKWAGYHCTEGQGGVSLYRGEGGGVSLYRGAGKRDVAVQGSTAQGILVHSTGPQVGAHTERTNVQGTTVQRLPLQSAIVQRVPGQSITVQRVPVQSVTVQRVPVQGVTIVQRRTPALCAATGCAESCNCTLQWWWLHLPHWFNDRLSHTLGGLKSLRSLCLRGCAVGDASLAQLAAVGSIKELDLSSTGVTTAGIFHLEKLKFLRVLNLSFCRDICAQSGVPLQRLRALEELYLCGTVVSDDTMVLISSLPKLRRIDLEGCEGSRMWG